MMRIEVSDTAAEPPVPQRSPLRMIDARKSGDRQEKHHSQHGQQGQHHRRLPDVQPEIQPLGYSRLIGLRFQHGLILSGNSKRDCNPSELVDGGWPAPLPFTAKQLLAFIWILPATRVR